MTSHRTPLWTCLPLRMGLQKDAANCDEEEEGDGEDTLEDDAVFSNRASNFAPAKLDEMAMASTPIRRRPNAQTPEFHEVELN